MAHYIDAEKLTKSVNNYREGAKAALNPIDGDADYYKGKIDACEDMKEFITSLQQEQPEVDLEKELEEEIERFYRTDEYRIADTLGRGFETLARHFAEWGAEHLKR